MSRWLTKNNPLYSPFDGSSEHIKVCPYCGFEYAKKQEYAFCPECGEYMYLDTPFTNAERIRDMTNDQLVRLFTKDYNGKMFFTCPVAYVENHDCGGTTNCPECFLRWLKQEVKHE